MLHTGSISLWNAVLTTDCGLKFPPKEYRRKNWLEKTVPGPACAIAVQQRTKKKTAA